VNHQPADPYLNAQYSMLLTSTQDRLEEEKGNVAIYAQLHFIFHKLNARALLWELIFLMQKKSIQEQIIMQIKYSTG